MSCTTNLARVAGTPGAGGRVGDAGVDGNLQNCFSARVTAHPALPFPFLPPKVEQSRCSIPPFERCKATPRGLLEHLVDRSTSHLSSLSHGFGLIFCALLCCSPRCSPRHKSPLNRCPPHYTLFLFLPPAVCLSPDPQIPCAAFICSCEEQRRRHVRPSTDINTFSARVIDSLTSFSFCPCRGLENDTRKPTTALLFLGCAGRC